MDHLKLVPGVDGVVDPAGGYPTKPEGTGRRTLALDYGDNAGGADSVLGRVTQISDGTLGQLASYGYFGASRRYSTFLNCGASQATHIPGLGYFGLDRFGRMQDLHYTGPLDSTLFRYEYGYDLAGNRTYARITQPGHDNDQSWFYEYDGLSRLTL